MRPIAIAFCATLAIAAALLVAFQSSLVPGVVGEAYYRQPAFFPIITLVLVAVIGVLGAVRYALGARLLEDDELAGTTPHVATLLAVAVLFALYIGLAKLFGYLTATLIFAIGALVASRSADSRSIVALVISSLLLYLVFRVYLDVWFPEPFVLDWLGPRND